MPMLVPPFDTERRRFPRMRLPYLTWLANFCTVGEQQGICLDVSMRGIGLHLERAVPQGTEATMIVNAGSRPIGQARGRVVRVSGFRERHVGIEFLQVSDGLVASIAAMTLSP